MPVHFFVQFEPPPDSADEFRGELLRVVQSTRPEPGCCSSASLSPSGGRQRSRSTPNGRMRQPLNCIRACHIHKLLQVITSYSPVRHPSLANTGETPLPTIYLSSPSGSGARGVHPSLHIQYKNFEAPHFECPLDLNYLKTQDRPYEKGRFQKPILGCKKLRKAPFAGRFRK